jgi:DNA gyrase subunit A
MITAHGQAIRFHEEDVRDMGRSASGVIGMRLKAKDRINGMGVIKADGEKLKDYQVLSVMANGYGKRTSLAYYKIQNRGGSGIKTAKITDKTGELINAFLVNKKTMADKDLIIMSRQGQVIRMPFVSVNESGRDTQGVCLMRFKENNDQVVGVTWL